MDVSSKYFHQELVDSYENQAEKNQISTNGSEDVDVIEKNAQDNAFINRSHPDCDNLMGKVVNNEDEAYNLYNEYAIRKGFSVRRSKSRYGSGKSSTQQIRSKEFCCSKAGPVPEGSSSSTRFRNKYETKSDCKAMIRFKIEDGVWVVDHFVVEHNHELASPSKAYLLRSNRSMTTPKANLISSMVNAGIRTSDVYAYISREVGGNENVGFIKRDCYNEVNRQKMQMIEAGDAQSLINYFKKQETIDSMFSYDIQVDQENRLTNFFWRDGKSAIDYDFFGDVVIFDTTYRKNIYNLICAPFIGLNHHRQNIMFGCAFLLDETTESFVWLFKSFLSSMGGKAPKTIFTDQDQAMTNAIGIVFPDTCHRLCLWHMAKHFPSHLGALNSNSEFQKLFKQCLYGCESEDELNETWEKMLIAFNLKEHTWLQKFYTLRKKWSLVLSNDSFSAGLLSTQRSESTNSVLGGLASRTTSLTQFLIAFEDMVSRWRSSEGEEDFHCNDGKPKLSSRNSGILNQAANVYTRKNFKLFEDEFNHAIALFWFEKSCVDDVYVFQVKAREDSRIRHVTLDMSTMKIKCSCKKFESSGFLCGHVLKILIVKNFDSIPERYILSRWSKEAKKRLVKGEATKVGRDDVEVFYRNKMIRFAYDTILKSQGNEITRKIVEDALDQAYKDVQVALDKLSISPNEEGGGDAPIDEKGEQEEVNDVIPILNPPRVKPKGVSNARLKGHFEKRKGKAKTGVKTKVIGKKKTSTSKSTKSTVGNDKQTGSIPTNLTMDPLYTAPHQFPNLAYPYHTSPNMFLLNPYGVPLPHLSSGVTNIPYGSSNTPQNTNQMEYFRSFQYAQQEIQPIIHMNQNAPHFDASQTKKIKKIVMIHYFSCYFYGTH